MNRLRRRLIAGTFGPLLAGTAPAAWPATPRPGDAGRAVDDPDLVGQAVELPGQLQADGSGPMSALLRAIAEQHGAGRMRFGVYPRNRVLQALRDGSTDFGFPVLQPLDTAGGLDPSGFRYGRFPAGRVSFVIYSRRQSPVTRAGIDAALRAGPARPFPYRIAALPVYDWGFPHEVMLNPAVTDWHRLAAGRIDAIVYGQEGGDLLLRRSGAAGLQRALFEDLLDVFAFPVGARGEFVEASLDRTLRRMRHEGLLAPLQASVHRPWNPWQP